MYGKFEIPKDLVSFVIVLFLHVSTIYWISMN